ncbi:MAG: hypothetical protein AAF632_26680 [Bacteroidota bacterium]
MNTSKRWAWLTMLLIGILAVGTVSCSEEDDDNGAPVDPGTEVESAWWSSYSVLTPQGFVVYLKVSENIPTDFNTSNDVELGLDQRVIGFEDHPYVYNPSAQTITKWAVNRNDLSLSVEGILSVGSTGISAESFANPIIVSETQAFIHDLQEGIMVEWNPTDMTITEVHEIEPLVPTHNNAFAGAFFTYVRGDKLIMPILENRPSICCDINTDNMGAKVAVYDINTKTIEYKRDIRLVYNWLFMAQDENGTLYLPPSREGAIVLEYFDVDPSQVPSPHTLLKFTDDGNYDPNFSYDFDQVLDIAMFDRVSFVFGNTVVLSYWDSNDAQLPAAFEEWGPWRGQNPQRLVSVDMITNEVEPFTALEKYSNVSFLTRIDGVNYYAAQTGGFGVGETGGSTSSHHLRQNADGSFTELNSSSAVSPGLFGKLWGD